MGKLSAKVKNNIRLIVQLGFSAVTNGYIKGWTGGKIYTGKTKMFCVPGLNCYSCPGALFSCPLGSLQSTFSSRDYKFAFYVLGILMLFGAVFGRFICGFLCPFGLIQDLLYKIPFFKKLKNLPGHKYLKWLKFVLLAVLAVILPMFAVDITGQGTPWFCKYVCPSGTVLAGLPLIFSNEGLREAAGFLFAWKTVILAAVVILSIVFYRPFCKYLCPLGAVYGLFNPIALYRYKIDENKCTSCGVCQSKCPADIPVWKKPNSIECIRCGQCRKACPGDAIDIVKLAGSKNKKQDKFYESNK